MLCRAFSGGQQFNKSTLSGLDGWAKTGRIVFPQRDKGNGGLHVLFQEFELLSLHVLYFLILVSSRYN